MNNVFYLVGLVVVVLFVAGVFGLREPSGSARDYSDIFFNPI